MNQRLNEKLTSFPETMSKAKTAEEISNSIVEIERLVLKSNFEDHQAGSPAAPYVAQDYIVGERNTRGLSWKLNLLRTIAAATFCKMVRMGVHGGNVRILGQGENIDTTLRIYETLVDTYDGFGKTAFTDFSDGQKGEEGTPKVHRAGWINQFLVAAPEALASALTESRAKDAVSNGKLASMVAERESALHEYASSLVPAKPPQAEKAPKAPKTPKPKKAGKVDPLEASLDSQEDETTTENEEDESTLVTDLGPTGS